jgi:hypothetical protein
MTSEPELWAAVYTPQSNSLFSVETVRISRLISRVSANVRGLTPKERIGSLDLASDAYALPYSGLLSPDVSLGDV